jgi:Glycoside hydrolase 123, catalytic domain/Glycoside hydrolase 123 N-terminal domain
MRTLTIVLALTGSICLGLAPAPADALEGHNWPIVKKLDPDTYAPASGSKLKPVYIVGCRNGIHSGMVVLTHNAPLVGLKAVPGDLKGAGTISAGNVEVFYMLRDGASRRRGRKGAFDSLEEVPPEAAGVKNKGGKVIQPLWIRVRVPRDAKAGDYTGSIKVTAAGQSLSVPLKLKVFDYQIPPVIKFHGRMDVIQSPESVAMAYGVELWSEKHFKLLDRSFTILGEMGNKTIYISAIRRTHFGNEHAMVRWTRDAKGELNPDFTIAEKYLDAAVKRMGKVPGVIFSVWEPIESMGHGGGAGGAARTTDKPIMYTLWDKKRNKLKKRKGPAWGMPDSKKFWKKFTDGVVPMLKKRGMEKSMLFGLIGDARPTQTAMDDICNALPREQANWAVHSHHDCPTWKGYNVGMRIALWGIHLSIYDPKQGHGFGWKARHWLMYYPREYSMSSSIPEHRFKLEMWMNAYSGYEMKRTRTSRYACGLGRIGGDFWKVVKDGRGRATATLAGYYPESYWGQLNLNYCIPAIMGKGKTGPLRTMRSEAFREGTQDVEVRVFVEKAIEIPEHRARVGDAFARKAREVLDGRIRMCNRWGGPRKDQRVGKVVDVALDWQQRNQKLYALAAEAAKKLGTHFIAGHGPQPAIRKKR